APAPRLDDRLVVSVAGDVHTKNQGPIVRHRRPPPLRCEHESQGDDRVVRLGREVALDPDLECRGFLAPLPAVRLDGLTRCKTRDYPLPRACIGRVLGVDVEQLPALRVRKRIEERAAGLGRVAGGQQGATGLHVAEDGCPELVRVAAPLVDAAEEILARETLQSLWLVGCDAENAPSSGELPAARRVLVKGSAEGDTSLAIETRELRPDDVLDLVERRGGDDDGATRLRQRPVHCSNANAGRLARLLP